MAETLTLTKEQLKELLDGQMQIATKVAETIVRGDPEVAAQKERDRERRREFQQKAIEDAIRIKDIAIQTVNRCSHKHRDTGKWTTGGQLNNDGIVRLICLQCNGICDVHVTAAEKAELIAGNISLAESAPPPKAKWYPAVA